MDNKQMISNYSTLSETDLETVNGGSDFLIRVVDKILGKHVRKSIPSEIVSTKY
ncbi:MULTISPECIES: ComC/BlpC family leader-containing pheromone/bacteriocin [Streptococcus]|uniref:Uncharacterized protein n=2 Tax=Streptococcus suis TaxID=1307 RepID=G7SE99_STRSU|nr:ComC/BlpC family leader-containing pheromone/bacteriocin [Streptococcus suis]AER19568.1 hypothetical protein SSUD12_1280 [Streptococcus suis D12]MBM0195693.1 ComC/BlpC family leader-containing pheromone/bacteriocin [Streptococcus suis]MBM7316961.1 ComC/BlpC family leader-containing pheromone/bacteriocin [Streptococcus suis]MCK4019669.1 ComC/BlpC family leader-containing pheromone/bacteriocin [Streptococcus suis]NQL78075.1 ComC/BlpC family leader-containing pheromone/bacteriocin [Streptococc